MIVMWIVIGLIVTTLVNGWINTSALSAYLEIKKFSNAYYNIGISFNLYEGEEVYNEELIIGLFFVNIIFVFHKEK